MPQIISFDDAHLPDALRLSQQAGWPHRAEDWALTLSASEGVVAVADGVVGTALCSPFGDVATLSMIIVDASMRGQGLGRILMNEVMERAGAREMRLVATIEGQPLYEKLGFVATGRIAQHQGIAVAAVPELPVVTGGDIDRCAQMDEAASGMSRAALLKRIAASAELLTAGGGFALLRDFGRGSLVGPIVARDPATARALLAEAASRRAGGFLRVDLRAEHDLSHFAETLGLVHVGGGTTMARGPQPAEPQDFKTFALVSQALG